MIRLEFPWPPPKLMPNYKRSHHWSSYRKPAKAARLLGWGLVAEARGSANCSPVVGEGPEVYRVSIEVTPPMRPGPTPDEDNLKGALKHYLDGAADALGVNDRQFRFAAMEWKPKEGAGKVVISIA